MRVGIVCKVLGLLGVVVSLWMLWPIFWAVIDGSDDLIPLLYSMALGLAISGVFLLLGRGKKAGDMGPREAFAAVGLSWFLASAIGGLPFWLHGTLPTYTDAFFEAASGFTTTGASVLIDIQSVPRGILFWRSLTHWLGGMGIIVLGLAILPMLGVGGMQLYKAEVPGPVPEKLTPRIQHTALLLWGVYVLLSALETGLLFLGGMNIFEALTHTFGTMATGGFSPLNGSIGQYDNAYFDWIIILFMFLAGANFTLHFKILKGDIGAWWRDEEFRFYTSLVVGGVLSVAAFLLLSGNYDTFLDALRFGAFQVVSTITTTGYVTADYEMWPFYVQTLLLVFMFVGGCAGSTGGGIKNVRILMLFKEIHAELMRLLHPKAVAYTRLNDQVVSREVVSSILVFFSIYIVVFTVGTIIMAGLGVDVLTAISGVAATLNNIGPGLGSVGPMENYASIPMAGKWVLSVCMVMGRLELYEVLLLFVPATWRR
ncbi:MAG TPA: potassium transporter TrkG [Thermosynergistes sp.]|nr:potassium transporter TrkG [Thermosynergistes sp.]